MGLQIFVDETFSLASDATAIDTAIGDGVSSTFALTAKTGADLAATVTAGALQYYQFNGGLTKTSNTFTLSTIPPLGTQIVAPGITAITFSAFDQDVVEGVTNPRVSEIPLYIGDPTEIHLFSYVNLPNHTGIRISFVDMVSGSVNGASESWVQLASSDPVFNIALTYAATGTALQLAGLTAYGLTTASSNTGSGLIKTSCASGSGVFSPGDYVIVNIGNPTQEIRRVLSYASGSQSLVTTTAFDFPHYIGETVYVMGRKFYAKCTIPTNAANNQAFNFWDLALRRQCKIISKV